MEKCPQCGGNLRPDASEGTFVCPRCRDKFAKKSNGELVNMLYPGDSRKGRDIEPNEWRKAEDGWRPNNW